MRVAALRIFPVKGCGPVALDRAAVGPTGLDGDRAFLVVDPDGAGRTQRHTPTLATIRPGLDDARLDLTTADTGTVTLPIRRDGAPVLVTLFGVGFAGIDQGDEVAAWLTETLGAPSRLVGVTREHHRPATGATASLTAWADSGAVTLISRTAVAELSDRIVGAGGEPVGLDRFRMNVEIDAGTTPHVEDDMRRVRLGTAELAYTKLAVRCAVTTVDQDTGRRDGPEPLRTLAVYRRGLDGGVVLGSKFAVVTPGEVAVGDELTAW